MGAYAASAEQANAEVAQAKAEVEANLAQLPDREKAIDACVEQQDFIEDGEARSPCRLKPAQVHSEAEEAEDKEVAPLSLLFRICQACAVEQQADEHGQQRVEGKPCPTEKAVGKGDQGVGETEQSGRQDAQPKGQLLRQPESAGTESCREEWDKREQRGDGNRWMEEQARHQLRA